MPVKKEASSKKSKKISKSNVGNIQTVIVKVGGEKKKRKSVPRKPRRRPDSEYDAPMRQLPPVVYQVSNTAPTAFGSGHPAIFRPPEQSTGIITGTQPKVTNPILEDIGQVGTSGRVEVVDVQTKAEALRDLGDLVPSSSQSIASISSSITQPRKPVSPTPSLFESSTIPSNIAFGTGTREQNVFDFGMEQVYDDPDDISILTNPTFRRAKPAKKDKVQSPMIGSNLKQEDVDRFFQPRIQPKALLEGILEVPDIETETVGSPSGVANPLTVIELQEGKKRLKKVVRAKSPPKPKPPPKPRKPNVKLSKQTQPTETQPAGVFA